MKDLDFDELDRAVNSLMTNVPDSDVSKPEEAEKTLDITSALGDSAPAPRNGAGATPAKPEQIPEAPAASAAKPLATPSPRPLASRRGGRFMDVVHPSSDMKSPTAPPRPAVSRQGVTVAPSPSASKPLEKPTTLAESQSPVTPEVEPSTVASEPSTIAPTQEQAPPANDWPDPLEMADFKTGSKEPETPAESETKMPEEVTAPTEEKPQDEPSPLTSPFLSGTKVEKRPLGGSAAESADEPDRAPAFAAKADSELAIADPAAQLPPTPSEVEPELPEELKGDLVAIEADTTTHHKEKKPEEPVNAPDTPGEEETPAPSSEKPAGTSMATPTVASPSDEKLLPAGPTSIPQQYHEEPSTGDQDNGAIYDTDTYHQPLAHPAKKKPGWLWVVWIVLILAVGAGAGAALYLLGIV